MSEEVSILTLLNEIKSNNTEEHKGIIKSIDAMCLKLTEHNGRLRKLEEWQNKIVGAIIILGLIVSGLVFPTIVKALIR